LEKKLVPTVILNDYTPDNKALLAEGLRHSGFLQLASDAFFPRDYLVELARHTEDFFSLPERIKMTAAKKHFKQDNANQYRGYFPLLPNDPAFKEGFELGLPDTQQQTATNDPFSEGNTWPLGFTKTPARLFLEDYAERCYRASLQLLAMIANVLDLSEESLSKPFQRSASTFRIMHYPPREKGQDRSLSTPAHVDSGFITLLFQDQHGGLEIETDGGAWQAVPPKAAALTVNFGKLFARWTGGKIKATRHRVRSPKKSRYSMAFFFEPDLDASLHGLYHDEHLGKYRDLLLQNMADFVEYQGFLQSIKKK